jgi:hypothetical protein
MSISPGKVVKMKYNGDLYEIFLTEDGKVSTCVVFFSDRQTGNIILFSDLPWPVRSRVEQEELETENG